jgi:membrane protein implicated in regulation of membrane protease activity
MGELVPIAGGLAVGAILGLLAPRLRLRIGAGLALVLGVGATFITGEHEISWAFVAIDIPIVALSSVVGLALARRLRARRSEKSVSGYA